MDQVGQGTRRRRSSRGSRGPKGSWAAYVRGREFGNLVFMGMVALAALYVARFLWDTRMASIYYNQVVIDAPERDVRYVFGKPDAIGDGGRSYRYDVDNKTVVTRFNDAGQVDSVTCSAELRYASRCESILDIPLGSREDAIMLKLGAPDRSTYQGDDKINHYDGLGLSFRMRKFQLVAIELHDGGSFIGYLPQALWRMIP